MSVVQQLLDALKLCRRAAAINYDSTEEEHDATMRGIGHALRVADKVIWRVERAERRAANKRRA